MMLRFRLAVALTALTAMTSASSAYAGQGGGGKDCSSIWNLLVFAKKCP